MQLSFAPLPLRATRFSFKQGLSGTLTGLTTAGAFTVVAFNLSNADKSIGSAFDPIKKLLEKSALLNGINQLGTTFYSWGSKIVGVKDAFKQWVSSYLNPSGLKAGAVALYNKLHDWSLIVYRWFRDKFWTFITNIPDMVKNWDKLRLSLFKWGTFLGGGGGAALWSMFGGSFDNLGKLAELMGNADFRAAAEKFGELVKKNPDAFDEMAEEDMREIFERMAEDPKEAQQIVDDLLQEQKEMAEKANKDKQENEKKEDPQLEEEQVKSAFKKGSPQSKGEVLGHLVGGALQSLMKAPYSSFDSSLSETEKKAKVAMEEYMKKVKEKAKGKSKTAQANQKFIDALGDKENTLISELAKIASLAMGEGHRDFKKLAKAFEKIMKDKFTVEIDPTKSEGSKPVQLDDLVKQPKNKI